MSTHLSMNPTTTSKTTLSTTPTTTTVLPSTPLPSDTKAGKRDSGPNESYPAPVTTYEEVAQNADVFTKTLKDLHASLGTKFMVPTIGGKALDLHQLFVEVTSRGGLEKVIQNRKWREIIAVFSFPATITNASFVLRKYYMSLLHHYEQVYYFRRQRQPFTITSSSQIWPGRWVTGAIDGKFDNGYLVTVSFGSEKLKGVLYHVPLDVQVSRNTNASILPRRRNRKRSRLATMDPSRPKPNRSGYNFFFSEHYATLKSMHDEGQEQTISTKIGNLWSQLSEAEKQVYRDKGSRDKERYRKEMSEYRKSSNGETAGLDVKSLA
ncbi:ARID/BRIGHT DNA-binding domain [Macleaya cordata]|uniref:ARID/BRIGHT DNA-binding domain n=1 Tax=Macleaya cordata TaxID=56857 RepID=A0A200PT76_MACCD|nr:ARID/BRIGHT DNA-binding domain [Macleaya cordata]